MINFGPNFELKKHISASRLDAFCFCSAKYAASYLYKLPDSGNPGSSRGSSAHLMLELLSSPKRKHLIPKIIEKDSIKPFPSLWRLLKTYANKHNVGDQANLGLIDFFVLTGLIWDQEPEGTVETLIEKEFNFEVIDKERGIRYKLLGFIDKAYLIIRDGKKYVKIVDYKSSKDFFKKEKLENNVQSIIYQLVARYLFPEHELLSFDFLFLKFRKNPIQSTGIYSQELLNGFEHYLTDIQTQIENFSLANTNDVIAYLDPTKFRLCGTEKEGLKKDGTPLWICPARKPMWYWVELDEKREIKKSYFENEKPEGIKVEKRFYSGCSFFFNKEGKPQQLSFQ